MKAKNTKYLENPTKENWQLLMEEEKSLTKKNLTKFLIESSKNKIDSLNDIYITNAIMCARKGCSYRGNNINLKQSTLNCSFFLKRQIEIVKPKVIGTLGYYPLFSLSKIFSFDIEKNLTETIKKHPIIYVDEFIIIPLYHPVAQIKKEQQLEQYQKIWENIKKV